MTNTPDPSADLAAYDRLPKQLRRRLAMTREEAMNRAVDAVCGAQLADYREGRIDRDKLDVQVKRRAAAIWTTFEEILRGDEPPELCGRCGREPVDAIVAGEALCTPCAASAVRPVRPVFL